MKRFREIINDQEMCKSCKECYDYQHRGEVVLDYLVVCNHIEWIDHPTSDFDYRGRPGCCDEHAKDWNDKTPPEKRFLSKES